MADRVPADQIEHIVGATRHRKAHLGRAVSIERTVYILHSQECLHSGIDLLDCRFTVALDRGIDDVPRWRGMEDRPVVLGVWDGRLVPLTEYAALRGES